MGKKNSFKIDIKYVIFANSYDDNMGGLETTHKKGAISYSFNIAKDNLKKQNKILPIKTFTKELKLKL